MDLKSVCAVGAVVLGVAGALAPTSVQAASQNDCAIWICLPGGFPSGCGGALSAFKKRIKKFKPPLPSFSSCIVSGGKSQMSYDHNYAALMPRRKVCKSWNYQYGRCNGEFEVVPQHYIKGTRCFRYRGESEPEGCIATKRFVDVYIDGEPTGTTYYW
ncbi:TPA: conjugal transfer protein TraL [Vibrio parahaemolyticus]|nr:conjugal transfer protein TraL [Vibrio parahaemolyticus]